MRCRVKINSIFRSVTFDLAIVSRGRRRQIGSHQLPSGDFSTLKILTCKQKYTRTILLIRSIYFAIIHIELGPNFFRRRCAENHFKSLLCVFVEYIQTNPPK